MKIWVQKWEESERGWGTRPDGYTIHKSQKDIGLYLKAMRDQETAWAIQAGGGAVFVPDEYSRPSGNPYEAEITDVALIQKLEGSQYGCRGSGSYPPSIKPQADQTGWVPLPPTKETTPMNTPLITADEARAIVKQTAEKVAERAIPELERIRKDIQDAASCGKTDVRVVVDGRDARVVACVTKALQDNGFRVGVIPSATDVAGFQVSWNSSKDAE